MRLHAQMTLADLEDSDEYTAFVDKFKPKKTTDDCITPPEIYEVILEWAMGRYGFAREDVVRPFWPGADYTAIDYPDGCVVLDNPPFSILQRIINDYMASGIRFFLFGPTMTALGGSTVLTINHIICHGSITYENGASVPTSFYTNLDTDGTVLESAPDLADAINAKNDELQKATKASLPKYVYPDEVITAAKVNWFCAHHTPYRLNARDCVPIKALDHQLPHGKVIFGGGLLMSERAAAERAAAERAAAERAAAKRWQLSDRELEIVKQLGKETA